MMDRIINQIIRQVTNQLVRGAMRGGTQVISDQIKRRSGPKAQPDEPPAHAQPMQRPPAAAAAPQPPRNAAPQPPQQSYEADQEDWHAKD